MRLIVIALAVGVLGAGPARAQGVSAARDHFRRGTTLYDLGRYHDAAKEYEAAFESKDDPALLFNIAQSYRLAHEYNEAMRAYRSFLRRVPDAPNAAQVRERIREMQELIDKQKETESRPPMGPMPEPTQPETPQTAPSAQPAASAAAPVSTEQPRSERTPLYKKWWLWTAVGGVLVVGAVVGIAVGVTANQDSFNPSLGKVGPGLTVVMP